MPTEAQTPAEPRAGAIERQLPARVFYPILVAGVLLGALAAGAGAWMHLDAGDREATGRRIWGAEITAPIAVMMGSTFGGLAGFAIAAVWDGRRRRTHQSSLKAITPGSSSAV
jgi:hypothetical protein